MQNKGFLILFIGLLMGTNLTICASTLSQDTFNVMLAPSTNFSTQVELFQQLSEQALHANTDLAIQYATQAWQLAAKNNDQAGIARSNIQLAKIYLEIRQYSTAISYYQQAMKIYEEQNKELEVGKIYFHLSEINQLQQNDEKTENNLNTALSLFKKTDNKLWIGKSLFHLGKLKSRQYLAQEAAVFFQQALQIFGTSPDFNIERTLAYIALGDQERNLLQYKNALENYFKALELTEINPLNTNKQICISNIGWTFYLQEAYQNALEYCTQGLENAKESNNVKIVEQNNKCLGAVYLDLKDYEKAIYFLNEALKTAKETGSITEQGEIYKLLSHLYERKGDFKTALNFRKIHQSLHDTLLLAWTPLKLTQNY